MKMRIVLSVMVLMASCAQDNAIPLDDAPVASQAKAIDAPDPCGVWVDRTQVMSEIRADLFPLRPDAVFFTLGTTTCSDAAWYCAAHYPSADGWYQGCTLRYIHAPGTTANGIGTSPSGPTADGIGTSPSGPTTDGIGTSPSGPGL